MTDDLIQLDTRGLHCPEPLMMLHQAVRKAKAGQMIEMYATDPSTSWDVAKFCTHLGHTLVEQSEHNVNEVTEYHYKICKKTS
ncbi:MULTISPECIES: sulfurtransferase TusA [unclassified Acinetobacter]|uniref:sulfurtransferase TusA n=1 Tax=unclassified Acinetobacter TaxID=196816 RepID=UPI0035B9C68A